MRGWPCALESTGWDYVESVLYEKFKPMQKCMAAAVIRFDIDLVSGTLSALCIVRKLPRLAVMRVLGLNIRHVKSVPSEGGLASLLPGVWGAGGVFCGYKSPCQRFILEVGLRGHAEKTNTEVNSNESNWLRSQIYFPCAPGALYTCRTTRDHRRHKVFSTLKTACV